MNLVYKYKKYYEDNDLMFRIQSALQDSLRDFIGRSNSDYARSCMRNSIQYTLEHLRACGHIEHYAINSNQATGEVDIDYALPGFITREIRTSINIGM